MPKQQITIEVDIPDGYEATGEFRCPELGELYISRGQTHQACFQNYASDHLILRKKWQWPDWLKAPWIAMDSNGTWWAYTQPPTIDGPSWFGGDPVRLSEYHLHFTPPPCDDWTKSLRKNPNID